MHVMRRVDRADWQFDFWVQDLTERAYDAELRSRGASLLAGGPRRRPWQYAYRLRRRLMEYPRYDIVHSHLGPYNGVVMRVAAASCVPVRISHAHNEYPAAEGTVLTRGFFALARSWDQRYSNIWLACAHRAGETLFGRGWERRDAAEVLYYGIDLNAFEHRQVSERDDARRTLGIPPEAFVIGHVGRFETQKNHHFLVAVAKKLAEVSTVAHLVLVGDGPLRQSIANDLAKAGLSKRSSILGIRNDVASLMCDVFDGFVLPSFHEGLPMVLLESQAAGLRSLCSSNITREADVIPHLVHRLPLEAGPGQWATVLHEWEKAPSFRDMQALETVRASRFNVDRSVAHLLSLYRHAAGGSSPQPS